MKIPALVSDQSLNWSDNYDKNILDNSSKASLNTGSKATAAKRNHTRFAHRTLQALRQTQLQMCRWPRPRPEVLPVCNSIQGSSSDGVRPAGLSRSGRRIPGQLSFCPSDLRGNLRNQPRTSSSERKTLGVLRERRKRFSNFTNRHRPSGYLSREYARGIPRRQSVAQGGNP